MLGLASYLELEGHTLVRIEGTQGGELETHYEYDMKTERGSFLQTGIVVMWCVFFKNRSAEKMVLIFDFTSPNKQRSEKIQIVQ